MHAEDSFCNSEDQLIRASTTALALYEKLEDQQAALWKILTVLKSLTSREVEVEEGFYATGCICCGASKEEIAECGHNNCDLGEAIAVIEKAIGGGPK
jgi:hypothetical protein